MTVTFTIAGTRPDWDDPTTHINLNNVNAADLLRWLDIEADYLVGEIPARELAARCRRRLWDVARNHDLAIEGYVESAVGCATVICAGRRAGYLRERTAELLELAERAGQGTVRWS